MTESQQNPLLKNDSQPRVNQHRISSKNVMSSQGEQLNDQEGAYETAEE